MVFSERLHQCTRASMGAAAQRVGPFLLGLDPHDSGPFRNYAVPDDRARPSPEDIGELISAFAIRGRTPRLEYVPELCPQLDERLVAAGFVVERRLPVLTCSPEEAAAPQPLAGIEVRLACSDADLWRVAEAQNEAYDADPPSAHDFDRLRRTREGGGLIALAATIPDPAAPDEQVSGVGGGLVAPPVLGVAELAAVGVRTSYRRRGVARALTALLTRACAGTTITTPFLTPAGATEERIYRSVGYRPATTMIHISRPGAEENRTP